MINIMLLNKCLDIDLTDKSGVNAFWMAAMYQNSNAMKILAEHGINVLVTDRKGMNALHLAAERNYPKIVK